MMCYRNHSPKYSEAEFKIDFEEEDWAEARDDVRKLRFFVKVMHDIDKAEDRFEDDDSFDLDDEF